MKRRMLSALLSVMLVIATICVSNMPSRAVEPDDEMTQDEMWTMEALENSEVTTEDETAQDEATAEVTEATTEELTEETMEGSEKASENITSTETIIIEENVDVSENSEATATDCDVSSNDSKNEISSEKTNTEILSDKTEDEAKENSTKENSTKENIETVVEDNQTDVEMLEEDMSEEELLERAEGKTLNNMSFWVADNGKELVAGKKCEWLVTLSSGYYDFDVYLYRLAVHVTDTEGNRYDMPVSVKYRDDHNQYIDFTNDAAGYYGGNNESIQIDANLQIDYSTYCIDFTLPKEWTEGFSLEVCGEWVKFDDMNTEIIASGSKSKIFSAKGNNYYSDIGDEVETNIYDCEITTKVYTDNKAFIAGSKMDFNYEITNNNNYDVELCTFDILSSSDLNAKNVRIIDPDGKNIVDIVRGGAYGSWWLYSMYAMDTSPIWIKAGETVTYKIEGVVLDDWDNGSYIRFRSSFSKGEGYYDDYKYTTGYAYSNNGNKIVIIDKKDEAVPDIKLDNDAYDNFINSAFTEAEIESGKQIKVDLTIAAVSEADVDQNDLAIIKAAAKKRKIAVILDMNLVRLIDGIISGNVNQLDKEITMTIDVPKQFQAANRKFSIIRLHDGIAEELPDLDDNPNTVTFSTGKFSLYALVYEGGDDVTLEPPKNDAPDAAVTPVKDDKKTPQIASPNTGDSTPIAALFAMMLTTFFLAVICIKRMKKENI